MGARFGQFSRLGLVAGFGTVLLWSGEALGQRSDNALGAALAGTFLLFLLGILLIGYVYMALALQTIAEKTATPNTWLAWIPIVNLVLMLQIAKKPIWWIILCFVPLVNIVIVIMVWMGIAVARKKPDWWGILMIVPVANLVVPGYLAWAD